MLNVMTIASVLIVTYLFPDFFPDPIMGVGIGVVLGGLFQFLIQVPGLRKAGDDDTAAVRPSHPSVKRIGRLALPVFVSSSVTQINIFIGTIFASFLPTGSITSLFYGMRFIHFPLGIFGISIATAILPTMSTQAARREMVEFRDTLSHGLRLVFFIMFPAMAGLIALRIPIVNLMLEHGQFDRLSTAATTTAVLYYAVGLWAFAGVRIVSQAFYSLQDTRTPVKIAVLAMAANILLSVILMGPLAHGGLALATSSRRHAEPRPSDPTAPEEDRPHGRRTDPAVIAQDRPVVSCHGAHRLVDQQEPPLGVGRPYPAEARTAGRRDRCERSLLYYCSMWALKSEEFAFFRGMVRKKKKQV